MLEHAGIVLVRWRFETKIAEGSLKLWENSNFEVAKVGVI